MTESPSGSHRPLIDFMIIGAQKCGTTALAEYLRGHPQIGLPFKESHIFDAPNFSFDWSSQEIDEHYRPLIQHCRQAKVIGEFTPIYLFFPEIAAALHRYNPNLKLIVLLRDRVERAISHYYMQKSRGMEKAPLWLALLAQPFRVRRCSCPRDWLSPQRVSSYRSRGLYSLQLNNLFQYFPREQVKIIRNQDLLHNHQTVLQGVFSFLGVDDDLSMPPLLAFPNPYGSSVIYQESDQSAVAAISTDFRKHRHRLVSLLLYLSYLCEARRAKALQLG